MHIIGTAGHVDHGKSALVRALTGTDPDRWAEEQLRGMTLDLGFAHLRYDDGTEAGIVDVPGHERFLHNMLAGAAGMELLLLVIDALEQIKPQTIEHLQILKYLNVQDVIVVLTKADLLEPSQAGAACVQVQEALAGTIAQDAPIFAVSSVTGYQLDVLKEAIRQSLRRLPPRPASAPAYLPVDRVFALPGHGTIVTGTLMQGSVAAGDTLMLQPSGKSVRVRSVQTFNQKIDRAGAGARVAVNVPAVAAKEIARGEMLVAPQFEPAASFAVQFSALRESLPLLRRRNPVRTYIGSAELLGTLVLDEVPADEGDVPASLFLKSATVAYPGTAFVVRRLSPKNVLGGGRIAGTQSHAHAAADEPDALQSAITAQLDAAPEFVFTAAEVARDLNLREDAVAAAVAALISRGEVLPVSKPAALVSHRRAMELLGRAGIFMEERQSTEPWILGVTSLAISRSLGVSESPLLRVLTALAAEGLLAHRGGYFSTVGHVPKLTAEQQQFFSGIAPLDPANPLAPVPLAQVAAAVRATRVPGAGKAFDTMLAKGALVKVNDDLYRGSQIAAITARVQTFLRENERMTMAQFRDLVGTSRKYAVPLLEWFDARGITVRSGDFRMLRRPESKGRDGPAGMGESAAAATEKG